MRKGIILAGGSGSRLRPITTVTSKQLLPVYDAPLIYYPLTTLLEAGIHDICIITTIESQSQFQNLLGDGSRYGAKFTYIVQDKPRGLAEAYLITELWLRKSPSALILGDNIFYGSKFQGQLRKCARSHGSYIFGQQVSNPQDYGVAKFEKGNLELVVEKPVVPPSNWAITGLYLLDNTASEKAALLTPSKRGELEIADLINSYTYGKYGLQLEFIPLESGTIWFDTGKFDDLLEAGEFVRAIQKRTGIKIADLEKFKV